MQVFVRRSSLKDRSDDPAPVLAFYEDATAITPEMRQPDFTMLSLPPSALESGVFGFRQLAPGWRQAHAKQVVGGEATRRILEAFPDHAQRNAALELGILSARHGATPWPKEALKRREEIESAWAYVNAVRQAAKTMLAGGLPADPTANGHWPKR